MRFDLMAGSATWKQTAEMAKQIAGAGFSGMLFTETTQTPWMSLATAAQAAPELELSTGIAVAFPRSPMIAAGLAWELAENTGGRFRLGLGSQVRAHIQRRYGVDYDPPGPRLKDYVLAVKDCLAAFRGEARLGHDGPYYNLSLLPSAWRPRHHDHGEVKVDISAVAPWMCKMAGEVADGVHVHPLHSVEYLHNRLLPDVAVGARRGGRDPGSVELIVPVFAVAGDTPEERAPLLEAARAQIAFYGSTKNYAFQFDDLGFEGTSARLNEKLKAGDFEGMSGVITDEILEKFSVVARWDEMADALVKRYHGVASRLVMYMAEQSIVANPGNLPKWGAIAKAVNAR